MVYGLRKELLTFTEHPFIWAQSHSSCFTQPGIWGAVSDQEEEEEESLLGSKERKRFGCMNVVNVIVSSELGSLRQCASCRNMGASVKIVKLWMSRPLASPSGQLRVNCERCAFHTEVVCWFGHGYRLLFVVVVLESPSYLWLRILSPVG